MATVVTDPHQLTSDMVLMPGGHDVPIRLFFAEHGDEPKLFADTKVAVAIPPFKTPNEVGDAFVAKDAAAWVEHHLDHGSEVKIYTLRELSPSIGHEAKDGWAAAAAAGRDETARRGKMPEAVSASMMSARAATMRR